MKIYKHSFHYQYHEIWPENGEEDYVDWRFKVTEINVIEEGDM